MSESKEVVSEARNNLPSDGGETLLSVIARAAADPETNVDKMERLMVMYENMEEKKAEMEFNNAMNQAQALMQPISADADNKQTRSKYATYGKLDTALRPIYTGAGFALSFDTGRESKQDAVSVLCYVTHRAGHTRTYQVEMPADGKGAKGGDAMTKTHATGAAMSYGMRYLLKMIFNVAVGEDDTDGNMPEASAQRALTLNQQQIGEIITLLSTKEMTIEELCAKSRVEQLGHLQQSRFVGAKEYIKGLPEARR